MWLDGVEVGVNGMLNMYLEINGLEQLWPTDVGTQLAGSLPESKPADLGRVGSPNSLEAL
jgi:hypothetical protein